MLVNASGCSGVAVQGRRASEAHLALPLIYHRSCLCRAPQNYPSAIVFHCDLASHFLLSISHSFRSHTFLLERHRHSLQDEPGTLLHCHRCLDLASHLRFCCCQASLLQCHHDQAGYSQTHQILNQQQRGSSLFLRLPRSREPKDLHHTCM